MVWAHSKARLAASATLLLTSALEVAACCGTRSAEGTPSPPDPQLGPAIAPAPVVPTASPARCGTSPWATYAHDAARTSATDGCCRGALHVRYRFAPPSKSGRPARVSHAIADERGAFVAGVLGASTAGYHVTPAGELAWSYDSRTDIHHAHWPSLGRGALLLDDDGLFLLDLRSGTPMTPRRLDYWGQTLFDGERFALVNTWHVEGPKVFVGAFDEQGALLWQRNVHGVTREDVMDDVGGIALDGGVLFQAASYRFVKGSGVFAFVMKSGEPVFSVDVSPFGPPSAGDGRVYLLERRGADKALVARRQSDGEIAWERVVADPWPLAPALADGRVLVRTGDGVSAFDAASGAPAFSIQLTAARPKVGDATSLVAALGSSSLLVTAGGAVHAYALRDGAALSATELPGARDVHSPVLVDQRLYVVADGGLVALDCE